MKHPRLRRFATLTAALLFLASCGNSEGFSGFDPWADKYSFMNSGASGEQETSSQGSAPVSSGASSSVHSTISGNYHYVRFDLDGGFDALYTRPASVLEGQDYVVPATKPTKDGYAFYGWNTLESDTAIYHPGDSIHLNGDLTLFAMWGIDCPECHGHPNQVDVDCHSCEGTGSLPIYEEGTCPTCNGSGRENIETTCSTCMGSGHLARRKCNSGHYWNETDKILGLLCPICGKAGVQVSTFTCPSCRGAKDIVTGTKTCTKCKGSGRAQVQTGSTVCTECNGAKTVKESDICCYCFGEGIVGKLPAPKLPMASYMQGKTYIRDLGDEYECTFLDFPSLKDAFFGGDRSFHINDRPYQSENEYLMPDATLRTVIVAAYRQKRTATRPFSLASKISIQTTAEDYAPPELNKGGHTYRLFSVSNPESGGLDGKEVVIVGTCDNIYWQNVVHRPYGGKSNLPLKYYAIKAENYDYDQKANWLRGQPGTFVGDEFASEAEATKFIFYWNSTARKYTIRPVGKSNFLTAYALSSTSVGLTFGTPPSSVSSDKQTKLFAVASGTDGTLKIYADFDNGDGTSRYAGISAIRAYEAFTTERNSYPEKAGGGVYLFQ